MTATQIAIARAAERMLVTPDGYGFVYVPGPALQPGDESTAADLAAARAQLAQTEESLRLARNEILSGIDAEQLRVTREIQAARRDAERQRDVARSERDHAYDNADSIWAGVVGRLTKERDAARAQLAAVVAAAKAVIHVSVPPYTEEGTKLLRAWNAVLADPAQAAHEHEERVRAEERERCESKVAEWQAIAGNATDTANAAWGHFAEVALLLGYKRAASPDFGEVDLVPLREHLATMQITAALAERCKAAVVALRAVVDRAACKVGRDECRTCAENREAIETLKRAFGVTP